MESKHFVVAKRSGVFAFIIAAVILAAAGLIALGATTQANAFFWIAGVGAAIVLPFPVYVVCAYPQVLIESDGEKLFFYQKRKRYVTKLENVHVYEEAPYSLVNELVLFIDKRKFTIPFVSCAAKVNRDISALTNRSYSDFPF